MKKMISVSVLVVSFLFITAGSMAQQAPVTDSASWQLVSNIHDPSKVTVQFYSSNGILMYEETLYNTKLNINKKKTVRKLNTLLSQVYTNWVMNRQRTTEKDLIAKTLR
ncbi:MAG TPA: hypothetical protein VD993_11190 [Chitinophagaceae bacterium]|nr:hypothetical protein [Chitinophagaceae bacterium]